MLKFLFKLAKVVKANKKPPAKASRRPSTQATGAVRALKGPGDFDTEIVGEGSYQSNLERLCGPRSVDGVDKFFEARLILEDENRHDRNAVRVDIRALTVGYLARAEALSFREGLSELRTGGARLFSCKARVRGGWDRGKGDTGPYGVILDLPDELT